MLTPLKPHFYIEKLGFTGVYIIFLFLLENIDCVYSLEPPRRGGSNEYPQSMFWAEIWIISEFLYENFHFFGGKIFNIFEQACFPNAVFFSTDRSKAVPLLQFFVCASVKFVRHYLFFISPSFGASGRLFFLIVTFPGYLSIFLQCLYDWAQLFKANDVVS